MEQSARGPQREAGFTLIELLVVVIIIGVLSAVAVPVFLNQRNKAHLAAAKTDLHNAVVMFESDFDTNKVYPWKNTELVAAGLKLTHTAYLASLVCVSSDQQHWALLVEMRDGKSYYVSDARPTMTPYAQHLTGTAGSLCPDVVPSTPTTYWWWLNQAINPDNWLVPGT